MLILVCNCQNVTLLEITSLSSIYFVVIVNDSEGSYDYVFVFCFLHTQN